MKLVNLYHSLYVKIYLQQRAIDAANIYFSAIIIMSVAQMLYALSAINLYVIFFKINVPRSIIDISIIYMLMGLTILVIGQMFYFSRDHRYKKILLEYNVDSLLRRPYYYMPGLIFEISSFLLFIFTSIVMYKIKVWA